jgi:hypothetical protein
VPLLGTVKVAFSSANSQLTMQTKKSPERQQSIHKRKVKSKKEREKKKKQQFRTMQTYCPSQVTGL